MQIQAQVELKRIQSEFSGYWKYLAYKQDNLLFLKTKTGPYITIQAFCSSCKRRDRIAFMKVEHSSVPHFHKYWLILSIIMSFLVNKGK